MLDTVTTADVVVMRHINCARCAARFELPPHLALQDDGRHRQNLHEWLRQHRDHTEALRFGSETVQFAEGVASPMT